MEKAAQGKKLERIRREAALKTAKEANMGTSYFSFFEMLTQSIRDQEERQKQEAAERLKQEEAERQELEAAERQELEAAERQELEAAERQELKAAERQALIQETV